MGHAPVRIRQRPFRSILFLGVLLAAQVLRVTHAKDTAKTFDGYWTYNNDCHFGHYAEIKLTETSTTVTGDWSDGTRLSGSNGSLMGRVRDGKLFVRYCGSDEHSGYAVCPKCETEENDYFIRKGGDLVWYRGNSLEASRTYKRYVVLHPSIKGNAKRIDSACPDDDN